MRKHLLGICVFLALGVAGCSFENDGQDGELSCGTGMYKNGSSCELKKGLNETCTSDEQCSSNICISTNVCGCSDDNDCPDKHYCDGQNKCEPLLKNGCPKNHVMDGDVCREVSECPDGDGMCFKAAQLTPPEEVEQQWNVGVVNLTNSKSLDYLGSAYEVYLPRKYVITCKGLLNYAKVDGKSYCDVTENANKCELRQKAGCYQGDLETLIPFTIRKKSGSKWNGRNVYFSMNMGSTGLMKKNEDFLVRMAPSYSVPESGHLGTNANYIEINSAKESASGGKQIFAKYDVSKCSSDDKAFQADMISGGTTNCDESYQFMFEFSHKSSYPNWTCDELYNNTSLTDCNDSLCDFTLTQNDDINITSSCAKLINGEDKDKAELCSKDDNYYGYIAPNFADPTGNDGNYWHSCRTAKILLSKIEVFVQVNDGDIE